MIYDAPAGLYARRGSDDALGDAVLRNLVITRVVEPTSLLDGCISRRIKKTSQDGSAIPRSAAWTPQIVLGLLVDRSESPLTIGCFEVNKAVTLAMVPIVKLFQARHDIADVVVVAEDQGTKANDPTQV